MYNGLKIVTSPHLTETEPVALTLLDRFFLFVERLCSEAEIYYYWKIVRTTREVPSKKAIVIGDTIFIHPQMLVSLKTRIKEFEVI